VSNTLIPTLPSSPYQQHHILISGATTGIGQCCALELSKLGLTVLAGYRKESDKTKLSALHDNIIPIPLDITHEDSISRAREMIEYHLNGARLIGLVNNAGIAVGGPLEFIPVHTLRHQMETNVLGHIAVTQAFIPLLRQSRGRIINMGSIAGLNALPFVGPYSASKFALESLTDALRVELQPWGIHVAIIEPGSINTPIWEKSLAIAQEQMKHLPPQVTELYGDALEALQKATFKSAQRGIPPQHVANAVIHALTAKRPRTRYLIGRDAQLRQWISWLPDRMQDWLITRKIGFPKANSKI
jgi:NAD(P)-dependent dehydrogenase (short-subunit alcohol dehydrogenase family)